MNREDVNWDLEPTKRDPVFEWVIFLLALIPVIVAITLVLT